MHIDSSSAGLAATSSRLVSPGGRRTRVPAFAAALLMFAGSALPGFAQNFLSQYSVAGPVGEALDTVAGVTFLYVADETQGSVLKINVATGATVATFGTGLQGSAAGQFGRPYGIAVDPTTHDLYVTERLNGRVQRINSTTGASIMLWGTNDALFNATGQNTNPPNPTSPQGHFQEPIGVAADAAGNVYVVDHGNNRVQKFLVHQVGGVWTADNVAMWGTTGSATGQFDHPYGAALDSAGNLLVADGLNGRVQKFSPTGMYQSTIGSVGTSPGQFVIATWVSLAPDGSIYVTSTNSNPQNASAADVNNQWVSKFSSAGTFVSRFGGTYGSGSGQFKLPFDAMVDASSKAYVSDYYNSRVQVFDLTAAPSSGGTSGGATGGTGSTGGTGTTSGTGTGSTGGTGTGSAGGTGTGSTGGTGGATSPSGTTFTVATSTATVPANGTYRAGDALVFTVHFSAPVKVTGGGEDDDTAQPTSDAAEETDKGEQGDSEGHDKGGDDHGGGGKHNGGDDHEGAASGGTIAGSGSTSSTGTSSSTGTTTGTGTTSATGATTSTGTTSHETDDSEVSGAPSVAWTAVATAGQSADSGRAHYVSGSGTADLTFKYQVHGNDTAPLGIKLGTTIQGGVITDAAGKALTSAQLTVPWPQNPLPGVILVTARESNPGHDKGGSTSGGVPGTSNPGSGTGTTTSTGTTTFSGATTSSSSTKADAKGAKLVNLSSRLHIKGGDAAHAVAVGFVVTGTNSQPVLVRAVGPGLAGFGITDALSDLMLNIRNSSGQIVAANSGWGSDSQVSAVTQQVGAFALAAGSHDAAVVVSLAPGAYTATIAGAKGEGEALIEVYDAQSSTGTQSQQLANVSTRGYVDAGGNVIAGFVVRGSSAKRVLVRAIGPGLTAFGVSSALADPTLQVHDASGGVVAENNDWGTPEPVDASHPAATAADITAADAAAGAFPLTTGSKDSAVVVTLNPGAYTAVVTGANNTSGAVLVEVYELAQ